MSSVCDLEYERRTQFACVYIDVFYFMSSSLFIESLRDVGKLPAHHFFFTEADLTPLILCLIWGLLNGPVHLNKCLAYPIDNF